MKKKFYLPLGLAALALLGTGCTAEDPANGLDINQTIFADGEGGSSGSTENPLTRYRISSYYFGYNRFEFDYTTSGIPVKCMQNRWSESNLDFEAKYDFEYGNGADYPTAVAWESTECPIWFNQERCGVIANHKIENLEFEGGLLKSLIYSGKQVIVKVNGGEVVSDNMPLPAHNVKFEYDGAKHLVKIVVDSDVYDMKWNAAGDLVEVNSPYYGPSTIEYTNVENRYGQWDPTLPVMGFFQTYGWFGVAPTHFPSKIKTCVLLNTNGSGGRAETASWYDLDYSIDYHGLIETVKWSESLNNYTEARIDYQYLQ
ncbi:MAG: hypothetical protein K2G78_01105 [Muribaculaceae bacterium]|nr:hypothetical protein [Muribaculaceae bacterium]